MLCKNGWIDTSRCRQYDEQKMSGDPSQKAVGVIVEKISSWGELSGAQLAGQKLVQNGLKEYPGTISKADFEV